MSIALYIMEHLPNEILVLIYNELTNEDIVNLPFHLTSRGLSRKDANRRFHHLFATWNQTKLKRLVRIAANPRLRDAVTKIFFCTSRPINPEAQPSFGNLWMNHVHAYPRPCSSRSLDIYFNTYHAHFGRAESDCDFCQKPSLEAQFLCCDMRYQAWNKWQRSDQGKSLLALAVAWLPNLKTICIDNSYGKNLGRLSEKFSYDGVEEPHLPEPLQWDICEQSWGSDLLKRIVEAVSIAQRVDRSVRTMSNNWPTFYRIGDVYMMLGDLLLIVASDAVLYTFEYLVSLEMTSVHRNQKGTMYRGLVCACSSEPGIPIIFYDASLATMIKTPDNLINLKINVWDGSYFYPFHLLQLDDWRPSYSHPLKPQCSISRLELVGLISSEARLSAFLLRTVQTLRHLGLDKTRLSSGTWVGVFDRLGGQFDLITLKLGLLSNTGDDIGSITGCSSINELPMNHEAEENLLNWLRGWADFHCIRLLMVEHDQNR